MCVCMYACMYGCTLIIPFYVFQIRVCVDISLCVCWGFADYAILLYLFQIRSVQRRARPHHAVQVWYMYVCMYICLYVCMDVCVDLCMHVCMYVCMCTYVYTHTHTYFMLHVHTLVRTYIHTYIHICTQTNVLWNNRNVKVCQIIMWMHTHILNCPG
jgi:hypothetical protein